MYVRVLDVRVTLPVRTLLVSACQGPTTSCSAACRAAALGYSDWVTISHGLSASPSLRWFRTRNVSAQPSPGFTS